jgi:hypothetical protein
MRVKDAAQLSATLTRSENQWESEMKPMSSRSASARRAAGFALCASFCVLLSAGSVGAKATYVTFDAGGWVTGINSANAVTGYRTDGNSFTRTVDGTITVFAVPDAIRTAAIGINGSGVVAGIHWDNAGWSHGFVRAADGTIAPFDVPGALYTEPSSINNTGDITGHYWGGTWHGFKRAADGTITKFDVPGARETNPSAVNDEGVITGYYVDDRGVHGFVRAADGTVSTFDAPGAKGPTQATSINSKGTVTGYYYIGHKHGFVRTADGTITLFEDEPDRSTDPVGINRKGTITGQCRRSGFAFVRDRLGGIIHEFRFNHFPTVPSAINDAGVIAGNYWTADDSPPIGFLRFP